MDTLSGTLPQSQFAICVENTMLVSQRSWLFSNRLTLCRMKCWLDSGSITGIILAADCPFLLAILVEN